MASVVVAIVSAIAAKRAHIAVAVCLGIVLLIFVQVAELSTIAAVGPCVAPARIRIVGLSVPIVFTRHLQAIAIPNFASAVHPTLEIVVTVIAIIAIVIAVPVLRCGETGATNQNCQAQCCHAKDVLHTSS